MLHVIRDLAIHKGQHVLREFNDLIPKLRAVGLGLSDVSVRLGFPPEISASLTGTVDTLDPETLRELIARNKANKTLVIVFEALITASNFKEELQGLGLRGFRLDVRLGIFPGVRLGLLPASTTSALTPV